MTRTLAKVALLCGISGTNAVSSRVSSDTPTRLLGMRTATSAMRPVCDASRAMTTSCSAAEPSVTNVFWPLRRNASPSGVSVVSMSRGRLPACSVTHRAAGAPPSSGSRCSSAAT
ncbi:MAG: hypothetical protein IPG17_03495 [Sandaracinaceae bacterium]|nr:hypothetical protein [Sandaracinaceae bacterium]